MKKISIILALCGIVLVGAVFGVRQIGKSKKTINVSVTELSNESVENDNQGAEDATSQRPLVTGGQTEEDTASQDKNATSSQPASSATEKKSTSIDNTDNAKSTGNKNGAASAPADTKATTSQGKIVQRPVSWGFAKSSGRTIKAIIVHTSYNNLGGDVFDFEKVIQEWKDAGVAPHYAIDRDGTIYQLVADQNIAWHAGVSKLPDGTTDVNGASIGVEVINSQDAKFTDEQYASLNSLIATLKKKYEIKYILGHDEIAPGRKSDPWNIDWKKIQK